MTYATQQNMIDRFGESELVQLTDRTDAEVIDVTVVAKAIEDAEAEINGYLSTRYTLPLQTIPAVLTRIACDITRYHLYDIRAPELVQDRYKAARDYLISVSKGIVSLGVDNANQAPAQSGGVKFSSDEKVFNADSLAGY